MRRLKNLGYKKTPSEPVMKTSQQYQLRLKIYENGPKYEIYAYDALIFDFIFKFKLSYSNEFDAICTSFPKESCLPIFQRLKAMGIAYTTYTSKKCIKNIFTPTKNRYSDYVQLVYNDLKNKESSYSKLLNTLKLTKSPTVTHLRVKVKKSHSNNNLSSFLTTTNPSLIASINDVIEIIYDDQTKPINVKICDTLITSSHKNIIEISSTSSLAQALLGKHAETRFCHKTKENTFKSGLILNIKK